MLELIERTLDEVLPPLSERPTVLAEAMRYAVGTGGKRIRPLVCLYAAVAAGGAAEDAKYPAAAIELLHNYTLIHDDLPSFDNDTMRRGKPTVWTKFGEATAILAGDALLSLSFGVAAKAPRRVPEIVEVLSQRGVGVVRGQQEDIVYNNFVWPEGEEVPGAEEVPSAKCLVPGAKEVPSAKCLVHSASLARSTKHQALSTLPTFIYTHKTSDLFVAAALMGALAADGSRETLNALETFANNLGLAFQYEDDLLDGDGLYSQEETSRLADETTAAALGALESLPGDVNPLRELALKLLHRKV